MQGKIEKFVSFYTLGCRLNQSETAVLRSSFEASGYRVSDRPVDIVVINTCTVTEKGDAEAKKIVNKLVRQNPEVSIALIGCQAQTQKDKLASLPNVKWIVGNAAKMDLVTIVSERQAQHKPYIVVPDIQQKPFTIPITGKYYGRNRVNIKIQDGCDCFCSFCEIPYARGKPRSREFKDILKEARVLVEAGHKELVLTGINIGKYKYKNYTLLDVIDALEQIDGLCRIRISSIEFSTIRKTLIKKIAGSEKLCRYLHIPLQSADDTILSLMRREYKFDEFRSFIEYVNDTVDGICIGIDIMAGFPGETDDIFHSSFERIKELKVSYFHVFSYSKRFLAESKNFPYEVPDSIIHVRSRMLRELGIYKRRQFYDSFLGKHQKVLFERKKEGLWTGLTDNYIRVKVSSEQDLTNKILNVTLVANKDSYMIGKIKEN